MSWDFVCIFGSGKNLILNSMIDINISMLLDTVMDFIVQTHVSYNNSKFFFLKQQLKFITRDGKVCWSKMKLFSDVECYVELKIGILSYVSFFLIGQILRSFPFLEILATNICVRYRCLKLHSTSEYEIQLFLLKVTMSDY